MLSEKRKLDIRKNLGELLSFQATENRAVDIEFTRSQFKKKECVRSRSQLKVFRQTTLTDTIEIDI